MASMRTFSPARLAAARIAEMKTKVQMAFNELAKGRTVIMIAHRLSTVVNADRIFVLKEGHLAESGSFAELSGQADSLFGTMWRDYQQSVQWKVAKEA